MNTDFDTFRSLPEILQKEAIREGEVRLDAQLKVAGDADRRALAWSAVVLTGASAAIGVGYRSFTSQDFDPDIAYGSVAFAFFLLIAAGLAAKSVAPKEYCFPGNRPGYWLPGEWDCEGTDENKIAQARIDQAKHLDKAIRENAVTAKENAVAMRLSMGIAFFSVGAAGLVLMLKVLL